MKFLKGSKEFWNIEIELMHHKRFHRTNWKNTLCLCSVERSNRMAVAHKRVVYCVITVFSKSAKKAMI